MSIVEQILDKPIAQSFGIIAMIIAIIGFTQKDDKNVFKIIILSNFVWIIHFLFMGIYSAAVSNFIGIVRIFLSLKFKKNKKIFVGVLFATIILGMITYTNTYSLLPIIGSCVSVYGFFFFEKIKFRFLMIITSMFWLVFDFHVGSIGGIMNEILVQSMLITTIYKMVRKEGKSIYFVDRIMDIIRNKKEREDIGRFVFIDDFKKILKEKNKIKDFLLKEINLPKIKVPKINLPKIKFHKVFKNVEKKI